MRQGVIQEIFGPEDMGRLDEWRRIRNRDRAYDGGG